MDVLLITAATACGYAQTSIWAIPGIALLLTVLSVHKQSAFARQFAELGAVRVFATSTGAIAANNLAFVAMAFLLGRGAYWLLSQ